MTPARRLPWRRWLRAAWAGACLYARVCAIPLVILGALIELPGALLDAEMRRSRR